MSLLYFITHPEVHIDPNKEITSWELSPLGRERVKRFAQSNVLENVEMIFTSHERKAFETSEIIAHELHMNYIKFPGLEENDRSATGYLPKQEFESVVDEFFAYPDESVRGWVTARQTQERIVEAFDQILAISADQNVVITSHGGVGALLLCHLKQTAISRSQEQKVLGSYFIVNKESQELVEDWQPLPQI